MKPEDLRVAVRELLLGDVVVLGAFEVRQPGPGDSTIQMAWRDAVRGAEKARPGAPCDTLGVAFRHG